MSIPYTKEITVNREIYDQIDGAMALMITVNPDSTELLANGDEIKHLNSLGITASYDDCCDYYIIYPDDKD